MKQYLVMLVLGAAAADAAVCDMNSLLATLQNYPTATQQACGALATAAGNGLDTSALECPCFSLVPEADAKTHYDCKFAESDNKTLLQMWEACAPATTTPAAGASSTAATDDLTKCFPNGAGGAFGKAYTDCGIDYTKSVTEFEDESKKCSEGCKAAIKAAEPICSIDDTYKSGWATYTASLACSGIAASSANVLSIGFSALATIAIACLALVR